MGGRDSEADSVDGGESEVDGGKSEVDGGGEVRLYHDNSPVDPLGYTILLRCVRVGLFVNDAMI